MDLDIIITGSLDAFFELEGDLLAVGAGRAWAATGENIKPTANTSVFAFTLGTQAQIVAAYAADRTGAAASCRIEQVFAEKHATSWQPWPSGWVISYKRYLRPPLVLDWFKEAPRPGKEVRIVAFHGNPRPGNIVRKGFYLRDSLPHGGIGAVSWVREYWLANGWSD